MTNFYSRAINDLISAHALVDEVQKFIVYGIDNQRVSDKN